jgi:uncharacterized membrane protein YesL
MLDEEQPAVALVIKIYHNYKQKVVEANIWGAFAAIGWLMISLKIHMD